jgi:hypothetical protein
MNIYTSTWTSSAVPWECGSFHQRFMLCTITFDKVMGTMSWISCGLCEFVSIWKLCECARFCRVHAENLQTRKVSTIYTHTRRSIQCTCMYLSSQTHKLTNSQTCKLTTNSQQTHNKLTINSQTHTLNLWSQSPCHILILWHVGSDVMLLYVYMHCYEYDTLFVLVERVAFRVRINPHIYECTFPLPFVYRHTQLLWWENIKIKSGCLKQQY